MEESDDFQILKSTSTEVVNSQIKILFSSQCMKAQAFLSDKLRKQTERQKEICKFIGSSNLKLEMEIKLAEQEIKSLIVANETIELGNVDLRKEYLLSKDRKAEILERIKRGKIKYENLWLKSKKKYDSIPIVQKLIETKNKNQTVQADINYYKNESKQLANQMKIKQNQMKIRDRALIVELAEFFVRERPKILVRIHENSDKTRDLLNEVELLKKEESNNNKASHDQAFLIDQKQSVDCSKNSLENNWFNMSNNTEKDILLFPKLHLQNNDLDILNVKLDQIQKVNLQDTVSAKRTVSSISSNFEDTTCKIQKTEQKDFNKYVSPYFEMALDVSSNNNNKKLDCNNYSKKKLINILEDIKLDQNDTHKIINDLERTQLHEAKFISSKYVNQCEKISDLQDKEIKPMEIEDIDEVNTKKKVVEVDVVDPPSQFLDISQGKKTVSFNIPKEKEIPLNEETIENLEVLESTKSQNQIVNNGTATEESYMANKDEILKQHNLDLSPEFVYPKFSLISKEHENKVASKFFINEDELGKSNVQNEDCNRSMKHDQIIDMDENKSNTRNQNVIYSGDSVNVVVSSPKGINNDHEMPMAGFLFNHGPRGIPESLNLSISTTGLEDSEDFPHCLDSSLLLSPKADISGTVDSSNNNQVFSQEVPNFLAGFRKTGLTFFGNTTSSETKPNSDAQSQHGAFSFSFSNEDKKKRGGFFSMFH